MTLRSLGLLALSLALLAARSVSADPIPGLFDTGTSGVGSLDSHYAGSSATPAGVAPYGGVWVAAPAGSAWISQHASLGNALNVGNVSPVPFTYTTTFSMAGLDPSTASLTMNVASDNGLQVLLNGNSFYNPGDTGSSTYNQLHAISTSSGFLPGTNTLTFIVTNGSGSGGNPEGLLVSGLQGTAAANAVPEPASLAVWGAISVLGAAFGWRRRRSS